MEYIFLGCLVLWLLGHRQPTLPRPVQFHKSFSTFILWGGPRDGERYTCPSSVQSLCVPVIGPDEYRIEFGVPQAPAVNLHRGIYKRRVVNGTTQFVWAGTE